MNIALVVLAFIFLLAGIVGSIVPIIPGPSLGYVGLWLMQWSGYGNFTVRFLIIWGVIVVIVTIMDYILPAYMTKWFGGSKAAVIGSTLGLIIGVFFFPPVGLIIGPFLGALFGELINIKLLQSKNVKASNAQALVAALGAFLAFLLGTGAKLTIGGLMIYYAIKAVI